MTTDHARKMLPKICPENIAKQTWNNISHTDKKEQSDDEQAQICCCIVRSFFLVFYYSIGVYCLMFHFGARVVELMCVWVCLSANGLNSST